MSGSLERYKPEVEAHPALHHPFVQAFRRGALTQEQLRYWVIQQYFVSVSLAQAFAGVYTMFPVRLVANARPLAEMMHAEAWGARDPRSHSMLFRELAEFLCVDVAAITQMKGDTHGLVDIRTRLAATKALPNAIAALALGNEWASLRIFQAMLEGIWDIPGCRDCPTGYFEVHVLDDPRDFETLEALYELVLSQPFQFHFGEVIEHRLLLDARKMYFDGLWKKMADTDEVKKMTEHARLR